MKYLEKFEQFSKNSEQNTLENWKEMMKKDLYIYKKFQNLTKLDIEQIREDWKVMRRNALEKLNQELNDSGKPGQLLNIDVSDEELYEYINDEYKNKFFEYSRILDFSDGYKPKDFILVKKKLKP